MVHFWGEGCIYLLQKNKKYTASFPKLPEGGVLWNEKDNILTLKDADDLPQVFESKMGDTISTNGHYIDYNPDITFNQGNSIKKCLAKDGVAFVDDEYAQSKQRACRKPNLRRL
ncbi:hypothetical protein SAMN02745664_10327 [Moraxella cuniculi DSM 21768]|uniref:Uncharacterized protein n=1 Tax=Moraxella cuniculi DSM 21768 TaxID=1122245 RepID=A0A1N7E2K9_9GAMM|nr:hypothetical protein [Moraxella cuniculi]OOS04634.1 hypothetical protein B0189_08190 [Moraxella cuniculi]SIR82313.1 hypothetical protein SAMN02745664_10327 [Moraxella cuniculi DSM 21768]